MDALMRNIQPKIERLLERFPIVVILGARQCGKSTLAKNLAKNWKYYDLENPAHFELISSDPLLFFKENPEHLIIDEAQSFPKLFNTT